MAAKSKIEWTDASWNPIRALNKKTGKLGWWCVHESPGCINCYAEGMNNRLGCGVDFKAQRRDDVEVFVDEGWDIERFNGAYRHAVYKRTQDRKCALDQPTHWRKPRVIFVCSMTDLFGEWVTDAMVDKVVAEMARNARHTFIVVTKRAKRMREYFTNLKKRIDRWDCDSGLDFAPMIQVTPGEWALQNVWLMVSAEDQRRWDERVPELLQTPAVIRGVSAEPLIELIRPNLGQLVKLDWIITGGESGSGARPAHPDWFRRFRDDCAEVGRGAFDNRPHYFHKQNGEFQFVRDAKPERVGKRIAGRLLDGVEHNARPRTRQRAIPAL